ncbi:MAG: hypothetical protein ABI743_09375, partial [bacterium]
MRLQGDRVCLMLTLTLLVGCGGVARNPSEPAFPARGTGQVPGQPGTPGEGGFVSPDQDPNLAGATSAQDFQDRAHVATLGGNLVTGVNGYSKMLELEQDNPEAALGLAVTTLWRDLDKWAAFTPDELSLTYFNTPLAIAPTLVPQPMGADDTYFWRLLSLGVDSQPVMDPAKVLADFLKEAGVDSGAPAAAAGLPVSPSQPISGAKAIPNGRASGRGPQKDPSAGKGDGGGNGGTTGDNGVTGNSDSMGAGYRSGTAVGTEPETRGGQQVNPIVSGKAGTTTAGKGGTGSPSGAAAGGGQRTTGGTGPTSPTGGGNPDPQVTLSQTTYVNFETDKPGVELVPKTRQFLQHAGGMLFTWEGRTTRLNALRASLEQLLTGLDRCKEKVSDDFELEIPVRLGDAANPQVYQIAFSAEDYEVIHQTLALYKWMLDYRSQYTTAGRWNFLVPLADTDADGVLTAAEYYPPAPFGTLTDSSKDTLKQ